MDLGSVLLVFGLGFAAPFLLFFLGVGIRLLNRKIRTLLRKRKEGKFLTTGTFEFVENGTKVVRPLKEDEEFGFHNSRLVVRKVVSTEELFGK